jgi:Ca2+-binding RTX toxin-like protein
LTGLEAVEGSNFDDTLTGNTQGNWIEGTGGNDALSGAGGNDGLIGGTGSDYVVGGDGDDYIDGGADFDYVVYTSATSAVTVNLAVNAASGAAGNDTLIGIEYVQGSEFGDVLIGGAANDYLSGGGGNDTLTGAAGDDQLNGGAGFDFASYTSTFGGVTADLSTGVVSGAAGNDTLVGIEALSGSSYNDTLRGDAQGNWIDGSEGFDSLYGNAGNDGLVGGTGNDLLDAGLGADFLAGGADQDTFLLRTGDGGGALNLADVISDYQDGTDLIGLGGGLTFADLTITQGTGPNAPDVIIRQSATGEYLAIVQNTNASALTILDFTQAPV